MRDIEKMKLTTLLKLAQANPLFDISEPETIYARLLKEQAPLLRGTGIGAGVGGTLGLLSTLASGRALHARNLLRAALLGAGGGMLYGLLKRRQLKRQATQEYLRSLERLKGYMSAGGVK